MSDEEEVMTFEEGGDGTMIDLSEVPEDSGFETIPRGTYDVIITKCEYKLSQSSGNPMWALELEVENNEQYNGRKLFTQLVFSAKMLGRTKKALAIIGCSNLLQGAFNAEDPEVTDQLIGKTARAVVAIGKNQEGEDRNEVKNLKARPVGDGFGDA